MTQDLILVISSSQPGDWIEALPGYQRAHLENLLIDNEALDAARIWLANSGPQNTAPYGGVRVVADRFYENLLQELRKFVCDDADDSYVDQRQEVAQMGSAAKLSIVSGISAAIGAQVGVAAVVIVPAVALTLTVLANAGHTTICDTLDDLIDKFQGVSAADNGLEPSIPEDTDRL